MRRKLLWKIGLICLDGRKWVWGWFSKTNSEIKIHSKKLRNFWEEADLKEITESMGCYEASRSAAIILQPTKTNETEPKSSTKNSRQEV